MDIDQESLKCRSKNIRLNKPICLLVENGYYTNIPKPYEFFKTFLVTVYKFNSKNDEYMKKLYSDVYVPYMREYRYFEKRNLPSFFSIFDMPAYRSELRYEYWKIRGYSEDWFSDFMKKRQSITTKDSFIKRYGEAEGVERYNSYVNDHAIKVSKPNKIAREQGRGYPYSKQINPSTGEFYKEEEARELNLENLKKGSAAAAEARKRKPFSIFQKSYWISKGLTEEEAHKKIYSISARNGIEYFVEKYGPKEGAIRYRNRIEKYKKTCANKTDEENLIWKIKRSKIAHLKSKAATLFFTTCIEKLKEEGIYVDGKFGESERYLYDNIKNTVYFYDFCSYEDKLLIEYNGIKFHPKYWKMSEDELKSWKSLYYNIPGDVQAERDQRKKELAEQNGYTFLTIWEDEPIDESINTVIKTIKNIRNVKQRSDNQ